MVVGWFVTGVAFSGLGVLLGAFGAHGLRDRLATDMLVVYETGVRYHLYHAFALVVAAWAASRWPNEWTGSAGWLFVAGIVLFSGSLYLLAMTGVRWLGAITPIGGICFLAGWTALAVGAVRSS